MMWSHVIYSRRNHGYGLFFLSEVIIQFMFSDTSHPRASSLFFFFLRINQLILNKSRGTRGFRNTKAILSIGKTMPSESSQIMYSLIVVSGNLSNFTVKKKGLIIWRISTKTDFTFKGQTIWSARTPGLSERTARKSKLRLIHMPQEL